MMIKGLDFVALHIRVIQKEKKAEIGANAFGGLCLVIVFLRRLRTRLPEDQLGDRFVQQEIIGSQLFPAKLPHRFGSLPFISSSIRLSASISIHPL